MGGRELRCIWAGATASALIAAGGVFVGPEAAPHSRFLRLIAYAASYGGVAGLVGAWLYLGRLLGRSPGPSGGVVLAALVAWSLPLLCGPVLFSRDLFSYAAQGREIVAGINPYHHGPAALGGGPYLHFVSRMWSGAPSPYGPFFLGLDGLIVRAVGQHALLAAALLRLLSCGGVALAAVALARLAASYGGSAPEALWLGVLNPLLLLHVVGGGHNEGLMLGLMVAGLALARQGRFAAGLGLCVLAAGVKVPAALGAVYVAADWMAACPDGAARAWAAVRAAATAVGTAVAMTAVAGLGWGWLRTLTTPARVRASLSPVTDIGQLTGTVMHRLHGAFPAWWALSTARLAGLTVAVVSGVFLLAGRVRRPAAVGVGLTLLALAALGPVLQPWYLLWGLVPVAASCPARLRPVLIWISCGASLLVLPDGRAAPGPVTLVFFAATAAVTVLSSRRFGPRPRTVDAGALAYTVRSLEG